MSTEHAFADDLVALSARLGRTGVWLTPGLTPCQLSSETERMTLPAQVATKLESFLRDAGAAGWVETTASVQLVGQGTRFLVDGTVLNAELCAGNLSLHVRHLDGCWLATAWQESTGHGWWVDECRLASAEAAATAFIYRVYATLDDAGNLAEQAARLSRVEWAMSRREEMP